MTGNLGFHIAKSSLYSRHPTFALVSLGLSLLTNLQSSIPLQCRSNYSNVPLNLYASSFASHLYIDALNRPSFVVHSDLQGSLQEELSLIEALNLVDVVICAVPTKHVLDQRPLFQAIKQAGPIKVVQLSLSKLWQIS